MKRTIKHLKSLDTVSAKPSVMMTSMGSGIFDESGDFGEYDPHSPFYIISMVMHDQAVDITEDLAKLETQMQYF